MYNLATIGFIGLGVMGEPMCWNIARKHNGKVIGFDIDSNASLKLAENGVKIASSLKSSRLNQMLLFSLFREGKRLPVFVKKEGS